MFGSEERGVKPECRPLLFACFDINIFGVSSCLSHEHSFSTHHIIMQKKKGNKERKDHIQERTKSQPEVPAANHLTCTRSNFKAQPVLRVQLLPTTCRHAHIASSIIQWREPVARLLRVTIFRVIKLIMPSTWAQKPK